MTYAHDLLYSRETLKLEILTTPINRLGYTLDGTFLEEAIRIVRADMKRVGITKLQPLFYLSNGYGCIEGVPNIALSFTSCDDLIAELNEEYRRFRYTPDEIVDVLRHEVGHAFCYAYKLFKTPEFRRIFKVKGHFFRTYPATNRYILRVNPWSKEFVNPGGDYYAQKHPDDDFAETFMVWMKPRQNWRKKYKSRPGALRKLEYVDQMVKAYGRKPPLVESNEQWIYEPVESLSMTVARFLRARPSRYRCVATGYVDPDLKAMFLKRPPHTNGRPARTHHHAYAFLRAYRRLLIPRVAIWAKVDESVVAELIDKLITRARALDLWMRHDDSERKVIEVTAYLATLCANFAQQGVFFVK
ncbi:MAG TPA: hypothetical protein VJG32_08720 [Anaerolineae bacterium]|nr:hypothetical protein [Anaerolineae bacterium]